jgi:hypothetical protein
MGNRVKCCYGGIIRRPMGPERPARVAFPVVAIGVGALAAVLLAEGLLRAWVWSGWPRSNGFIRFMKSADAVPNRGPLFRPSADADLGYELVPNARRGAMRINAFGFRGPELREQPAPGVVRVAVIGDSETFGAALEEERTLPGRLQTALAAADRSRGYEVLNLGVPGYNTLQELRLVQATLPRLHPQVVVLYYVLNDAELTPRAVLLHRGPLRSSHVGLLLSYVRKAWPADPAALRSEMDIVSYYQHLHAPDRFEVTRRLLLEMAETLRGRGVRFVLVIAPEIYAVPGFNKRYPYRDIHARLAGLAGPGLEVVDPLDRLAAAKKRPRQFWVSEGDPHKNEEANAIIAGAIAEALLRGSRRALPGEIG